MRDLTVHCRSEEETESVGERIGHSAAPGTVVACRGSLGAGKTTLVRGLVRGAGSPEAVTSPTFVLLHIYEGGRLPVYHFDAYRLSGPDELLDIGCEEYFWGDGISVVEWAERAEGLLPGDRLEVDIVTVSPRDRALHLTACGELSLRILESVR